MIRSTPPLVVADSAPPPCWKIRILLSLTLAAIVGLRVLHADQPIVENYVGRQIPTAMVARNLDRGSGFLRPKLDTAPFPNYFLVEPPVYELVVSGLHRAAGWRLETCGRVISACATALGAWGLFGLIRRRERSRVALAAVVAFSILPVTIRYGRSFQPDALMLGAVLAGLACWDRSASGQSRYWLVPGWLLLALGFSAKVTGALVLIPLVLAVERPRSWPRVILAATTLGPVLLWYVWANHLIASGAGSRASAENRAIWSTVLGFSALGSPATMANLWRFLVIRAFTPPALTLGLWGLWRRPESSHTS